MTAERQTWNVARRPAATRGLIRHRVTARLAIGSFLILAAAAAPLGTAENLTLDIPNGFPQELLEHLQAPTDQDLQRLWTLVQRELDTGSMDDIAAMLPYVRNAIAYLSLIAGDAPMVDWLRQRLDYFEAADEIVRRLPAPRSARAPYRPPSTVVPLKPLPPVPPAPPAVRAQRDALAHDVRAWKHKMAARPAPEDAAALAPRLKSAFRAEGVPPQLVWIAEVESTMDADARSPQGATGLFQFMPDTARRFGLRTWPLDERRNPEKSARAAAQYLKTLHREFGSWPLALAAYNAGEGCVGRLLKGRRERTFEAIADDLPVETQMYVPKVLAVIALREHGVDAGRLPGPTACEAPREGGGTAASRSASASQPVVPGRRPPNGARPAPLPLPP